MLVAQWRHQLSLHTPRPLQPCTQNCFDSGSEGWPGPHSHCSPNQPGRQWHTGSPTCLGLGLGMGLGLGQGWDWGWG